LRAGEGIAGGLRRGCSPSPTSQLPFVPSSDRACRERVSRDGRFIRHLRLDARSRYGYAYLIATRHERICTPASLRGRYRSWEKQVLPAQGSRARVAVRVRLKMREERILSAAPARSPTRPPNGSILWVAGWGSGPVPQCAHGRILKQTLSQADAKWGPASLPTPCRRTSTRLAPPGRHLRLLVSAACSTRAANGPRLRISVTGAGRDTLSGLNTAVSGGQLDSQAETRQSRLGHYLRITFHPLPGSASPAFTANALSMSRGRERAPGTPFPACPPSLRSRDGGPSCTVRHSPGT
jgi:hypothetical protein